MVEPYSGIKNSFMIDLIIQKLYHATFLVLQLKLKNNERRFSYEKYT